MAKDLDQLSKQLDKISKELNDNDKLHSKEIIGLAVTNNKLSKDISDLKKDIKAISTKVDFILQILNNFTLLLSEDNTENLNDNESWIPEQEEDWNTYDDDDESL